MKKPLVREELGYTIATSCPVCKRCWMNRYGKCMYGGPFKGYVVIKDPA